jgi:hypothetical protein
MRDYEAAMANGDLEAAAKALASAANKEITPEVVNEVNKNLGIESELTDEEVAAAATAEQQAAANGEPGEGQPAEEDGDEIAQAAEDLIDGADGNTTTQ